MKALILSSNTGEGHNSCARAMQEALMGRGIPCDILDGLSSLSKVASRFLSEWHSRLYRTMPKLYGKGYGYAEKHTQCLDSHSLLFRFLGLGAKSLRDCVASQGYTHVLCTHLFPAMMLTQLQRQSRLPIATGFIATDYTASPGYEAVDLDWCFVPAPEIAGEFVKANMPEDRIVGCGMPVCRVYRESGDRAAAKRALGIDPNHRHLLVMSGSMGCGPLKHVMKQLAGQSGEAIEISVICGTNRRLSRQLRHLLGDCRNVHIHDYVDRVALFMDSADLYLTKPGGLSVSEALAKRLPMVLLRAVDGCETHNMRYCVKKGAAITANDMNDVAALCIKTIQDNDALRAMREAMGVRPDRAAAEIVCDHMLGGNA